MSPLRFLLQKCFRAACCAGMAAALLAAPSALAQSAGEENSPVQAETSAGDSRPATLGDLRHLEITLRTELREIHETIRWLIVALFAVLGLPQLSAWWDRHRGGGNGKGVATTVSFALAAAPWALGAFAVAAAIAG